MANLVDTASSGDQLATLEMLRDEIARAIQDSESGRDIAALSRQLTDVMDRIDEIKRMETSKRSKDVPLNAILQRHAERRTASKNQGSA